MTLQRVSSELGPHKLGSNLSATCVNSGGVPAPALAWWRGDQVLDTSYEEVTPASDDRDSVLVLVTLAGGGRVGPGNVSPVTVNYVSLTPATTLLTTTSPAS